MHEAVARCKLDLAGKVVFTEAATGAYAVTPILAALAGAPRIYGVTRNTPYGTVEEVRTTTEELSRRAGVAGRIVVVPQRRPEQVAEADIVTNSGHVRPLDSELIGWMKPGAVIPLMGDSTDV
jgi:orotidine-5'-phosphate decarboxylase